MEPDDDELRGEPLLPPEPADEDFADDDTLSEDLDAGLDEPELSADSASESESSDTADQDFAVDDVADGADADVDIELTSANASSGTAAAAPTPTFIPRLETDSAPGDSPTSATRTGTSGGRGYLLPLPSNLPNAGAPDPARQIFPQPAAPQLILGPTGSGSQANSGASSSPVGQPLPRLQVLVSMAESRAMYIGAIQEVLDAYALKFQQIARSEVESGFRCFHIERRVAEGL